MLAAERFGAPAQIRMADLHVLVSPPGDCLMAAVEIRAYCDDSGDERDSQHTVISAVCYLSNLIKWGNFEREWAQVLGDNHVPYLHMKEWWNEDNSVYSELKKDKAKEQTFFSDLVGVIKRNIIFCAATVIRLPDLRDFNRETGLDLDAFSLALYGCIIELRNHESDQDIQIVIDKITKPHRRIGLAKEYSNTDTWKDLKSDGLLITPLEKEDSFKTVLPIQACDFMAWEMRRNAEERKNWNPSEEERKYPVLLSNAYRRFSQEFFSKHNRQPRDRKSAWALYRAVPPHGYLWDFQNIRAAHINRHKKGWKLKCD